MKSAYFEAQFFKTNSCQKIIIIITIKNLFKSAKCIRSARVIKTKKDCNFGIY